MLKKPSFVETIFSEKSKRTAMEENPLCVVPETKIPEEEIKKQPETENKKENKATPIDFDLSDIRVSPKKLSKEEIIAAAEAAAFEEEQES